MTPNAQAPIVEPPARVRASSVPTVSVAQMTEVDRLAISEFGVTLVQMMEQAGAHLAEVVRLELGGDLLDRSVVVVVGPGNNGGGGLVAARHLLNRGARVRVVLARPALRMSEAGRYQRSLSEKLGLLSELALFEGLSDADIEAIGHATTMTHCKRGQQILAPDDPPDRIHIIKKGRVRVYRLGADGKQLTLDIYEKGTILGDMSMLGQDRIPEAYAEALDDGVICTITPDELRKLIERFPLIGVNIIGHLSRRLQSAKQALEAMAYRRVDQRLARRLLDLAARFGMAAPGGTVIEARLTQQELAEMVGTTRETLAHTLGDLRRDGLLDMDKHRVLIRDAERLAELADG